MSRVAAPKVPGETVPAASNESKTVGDTSDASDVQAAAAEPSGETVAVERVQLDNLLAQVAALSNKVRTIEAAKPVTGKRVNPTENLPDASAIDTNTLKSPVLTKQGWLVPETFGSNPNAPKAF